MKLGVKRFQAFRFDNQVSPTDYYFFTKNELWKVFHNGCSVKTSNTSLNWLLDPECKVIVVGDPEVYSGK
jgi:hypothetical protein